MEMISLEDGRFEGRIVDQWSPLENEQFSPVVELKIPAEYVSLAGHKKETAIVVEKKDEGTTKLFVGDTSCYVLVVVRHPKSLRVIRFKNMSEARVSGGTNIRGRPCKDLLSMLHHPETVAVLVVESNTGFDLLRFHEAKFGAGTLRSNGREGDMKWEWSDEVKKSGSTAGALKTSEEIIQVNHSA